MSSLCKIYFRSLWRAREERPLKLPRLREVRELRGWSQGVLAEKADVSRDSISNYETGHREAYPATARKLADALEVGIGALVEPTRAEEPVLAGKTEAPREAGPTREVMWPPNLEEWLKEQGAPRILMTDEEVIENFERIAFGSDRRAIPDRFEQEARKTFEEEASVENALTTEWVHGGPLLRKPEAGPGLIQRAFDRHKEYSRLKREVLRSYSRYYRALEAFTKALFFEGRADDFVILNKRPQTVEAIREATRALQEEARENRRGA
jgi:transcriptional regulator with XRE-family HTH domain